MRAAIISPIPLLYRYSTLSSLQMALAQLWIEEEYRMYFLNRKQEGDTIILDNGAYELGQSLDISRLEEVAEELQPDVLILPDAIMNKNLTLSLTEKALSSFQNKYTLMAVPQGSDDKEWLECLRSMGEFCKFLWWGVPKVCQLVLSQGRPWACREILKRFPDANIHLLGVWSDPIGEIKDVVDIPGVRSIDTALPISLGKLARSLEEHHPHPSGGGPYEGDDPFPEWTLNQVQRFLRFVNNGQM